MDLILERVLRGLQSGILRLDLRQHWLKASVKTPTSSDAIRSHALSNLCSSRYCGPCRQASGWLGDEALESHRDHPREPD
jgi:hypothetical protein